MRCLRASLRPSFLSTLSLRRATTRGQGAPVGVPYFYPRSPCGERHNFAQRVPVLEEHFYPRSPCGERPNFVQPAYCIRTRFYPRSPCGERLHFATLKFVNPYISIHALLAESDVYLASQTFDIDKISIHALLAESDVLSAVLTVPSTLFLSTLSLRRATILIHIRQY